MKDHLSPDQKAQYLLGQAGPEEVEHLKRCPECNAEVAQFRDTVGTFQHVMKNWSEREGVWQADDAAEILSWQPRPVRAGRWVFATAAIALAVFFAAYPSINVTRQEPETPRVPEVNDDVLLMEAVATHLSRPLPAPMERVMALLPTTELEPEMIEREELR